VVAAPIKKYVKRTGLMVIRSNTVGGNVGRMWNKRTRSGSLGEKKKGVTQTTQGSSSVPRLGAIRKSVKEGTKDRKYYHRCHTYWGQGKEQTI